MLPLLQALNGVEEDSDEPRKVQVESKVVHGTRASFVALVIEAVDFYINNSTKTTTFHAPRLYRFGELLLQNLYHLHVGFNVFFTQSFLVFMNEKLTKAPDEKRSIK